MLTALATLLSLQLTGEVVARWLALPVPGPVLGMATLLLALAWRPAWLTALRSTAQGLLQHLSLMFVPAGVGVMLHLQRLGEEAWAVGVAVVLSTWIGMATTALTVVWLMAKTRPHTGSPPDDTP